MNFTDILKAINDFRCRKFLIVLGVWYLVYVGKIDQYWATCITIVYFLSDLLEKYIVHKSEEDCNELVAKDKSDV
jgi:hypothetical protein